MAEEKTHDSLHTQITYTHTSNTNKRNVMIKPYDAYMIVIIIKATVCGMYHSTSFNSVISKILIKNNYQ